MPLASYLIFCNIDLEAIFAVLRPGFNIERVMKEKWARIIAIQLVDGL